MKNTLPWLAISALFFAIDVFGAEGFKTETFAFKFDGNQRVGVVDLPTEHEATAIVLIIPGDGKTDIVAGNWFYQLRSRFAQTGIACCIWDKAGCGRSEGQYDPGQSVQSSAQEALAAIAELKRRAVPGSKKIGLWGISRAGWVCPLVISGYPSISFWISVSGTDGEENFRYLLEKNFRIEGRDERETRSLVSEWQRGFDLLRKDGTFDEYLKATQILRQDPFYKLISSEMTQDAFVQGKKRSTAASA